MPPPMPIAVKLVLAPVRALGRALYNALYRLALLPTRRARAISAIGDNLPNGWIAQVIQQPDGSLIATYISGSIEHLLGYSPAQFYARPELFLQLIHPEDYALVAQSAFDALRTLTALDLEARLITASGETRWFQVSAMPRRLGEGTISWESIQLDITARKQAAEAQRANESAYRALAIEHSRLYSDARRQAEELETLRRAGAVVAASLDLNEAIDRILEQLALVVPYDSASVQLRSGDDSEVIGCRGFPDPQQIIGLRFPILPSPLCRTVYSEAQTLILPETSDVESFIHVPGGNIRSWLGLPLVVSDQVIGMLTLDSATPGHFTAAHTRLGLAFAHHVALALKHAQSYRREVRARERLMALQQATRELATHHTIPAELYAAAYHAILQLMPAEGFVIMLFDLNEDEAHDVYLAYKGKTFQGTSYPREGSFADMVVRSGHTLRIDDFATYTDFTLDVYSPEDATRSGLAVVLQGRTRTLGVLFVTSDTAGAYQEDDAVLLELLAAHVVIALENGALFAEVERLATTDALTGLANRRHFFAQARIAALRCHRQSQPLAIALLDLDHFKEVNDTYGHQAGDLVLQEVARTCRECVRSDDLVARYGGEELAILMPGTDLVGAAFVAERVREAIAEMRIKAGGDALSVTTSAGVSISPSSGSVETALACADNALYAAKAAGRNCVVAVPSCAVPPAASNVCAA